MRLNIDLFKLLKTITKKDKKKLKEKIFSKIGICPKCGGDLLFDYYKNNSFCPQCVVKDLLKGIKR